MSQASTTEPAFSVILGEALRQKHPLWTQHLGAEQTRVMDRAPGKQPDIVIAAPNSTPVIVETEYFPAVTVEQEARARLNESLTSTGRTIEHTFAVRIPGEMKTVPQGDIKPNIEIILFDYCIFSLKKDLTISRWPVKGWLKGDINDLATSIESVSISESLLAISTDELERGVAQAANILQQAPAHTKEKIAQELRQETGEQTARMATAIIANAIIFHTRIEGQQGVPTLSELQSETGTLSRNKLVECWRWIVEEINYHPIFKIASDLLRLIPTQQAGHILKRLVETSDTLTELGATGINDLSGRMFQTLISDRKFLATFYTLPVSATLLAELAVARLDIDWNDENAVKALRVGDLACGTGALLNAAYHSIRVRFRRTGNDDASIHAGMIESSLYACDIMPAATHLTASTLSNAHPGETFGNTKIITMPYGYDENNVPHIGSLELIAQEETMPLFSLGREQLKGRAGEEANSSISVPHQSMDVVIMNPPFTRPTNHESTTVPVPSFAGFGTEHSEQKAMSERLKVMRRSLSEPAGNGNAGLASNFLDLAHVKLKPGGVLALVLPASFAQGESWSGARALLSEHYQDMVIVSIANIGKTDQAFSADTGMAEVLVVAKKKADGNSTDNKGDSINTIQFANLVRRPVHHVAATAAAKSIETIRKDSGMGHITLGDEYSNGGCVSTDHFEGGCAGLVEPMLAQFMLALAKGVFLHTRTNQTVSLPITTLRSLGRRGLVDRDFIGALPRGPFDKIPLQTSTPTYPALWNHDAERERAFIVEPDCELRVRTAQEERAASIWRQDISRLHLTRDFRLNSQSLGACFTPEKSVGGRAWPNFIVADDTSEKILLLWFNSTLGLMSYWWGGTRQQLGRTVVTISALPSLIVLDTRQFKKTDFNSCDELFKRFEKERFLPANEACHDQNRIALDKALFDLLGVSPSVKDGFDLIRRQWCNEPSVHGGKHRIKN
ncbi:MAG: hypothetical protein OXI88_03490 [Gammaproteobacteria bacterium]|nr:hypothetical protein [Gammaproteobacteria bacterium]